MKVFSTEADAFDSMAVLYPELMPLASVVRQMSDMKTFALDINSTIVPGILSFRFPQTPAAALHRVRSFYSSRAPGHEVLSNHRQAWQSAI
jgi:hypothetical protein